MGKGGGGGGNRGRDRGGKLRFDLIIVTVGTGGGILELSFVEGGGTVDRRGMGETSFEEVGGDGETCVVGIGGLPNILKPLWDTVGVDGLEEETRRVVPEESKPEGRVFRREGTHEIKKGKREEGGLNV